MTREQRLRKDLLEQCKEASKCAMRYIDNAIYYANEHNAGVAKKLADAASLVVGAAMKSHDLLRAIAGENMTREEAEAYFHVQTACGKATEAHQAAKRANAEVQANKRK